MSVAPDGSPRVRIKPCDTPTLLASRYGKEMLSHAIACVVESAAKLSFNCEVLRSVAKGTIRLQCFPKSAIVADSLT